MRKGNEPIDASTREVSVFALEHEPILDRSILFSLRGWSREETERMEKFRDSSALTSYCLSRVLARKVLSFYSGEDEARIVFAYGKNGKPFMLGEGPRFNWSHARGCVLMAVSGDAEIGADIEERTRDSGDSIDIARRFFTKEEAEWIESDGESRIRERFFSIFVQKEAYLKMTGEGLSGSLEAAEAFLESPFHQSGGSVLFRAGRDEGYIAAVRVAGAGETAFSIFKARFDPVAGILPVERWTEVRYPT